MTGPLASASFRWLLAARTTSLHGNAVAPVALAFAVLDLTGSVTVPLLVVLSVVNGAVSAVSFPASSALTPQTVAPEVLQSANAVLRIGANGSAILGAALGGIVVAGVGPGWGLAVDAASFLLAAGMFRAVRQVGAAVRPERTSVLAELREGWGEFRSRPGHALRPHARAPSLTSQPVVTTSQRAGGLRRAPRAAR